ncbi:Transcriptional regulator, PadR family [Halanaeroarchaeum sp. HSR-CO]|uniref:PadR family transcriptional regulator n=1 Tax=Halanaeroarchaeum sp. HSR-CO TaxID=2866382 RepID=UPI00217D8630|nr:PadR family transcriptional regulator [Halanaeroarchaeum sp. HSR-CO]UWG47025.1 Transcriptional regulator, PadR family [Halanaeroarchaeum sp. HSR-CO]
MTGLSMADLTGFQRDVLVATRHAQASNGAPNGQAIIPILEANGYENIQSGRFYPTLDDLVRLGLLEKRQNPEDKRANHYEITEQGEELLEARRQFLDRSSTTVQEGSA